MSAGAPQAHDQAEGETALADIEGHPWFQAGMAIPFKVSADYDIPYLGGVSNDGRTIYIDRTNYPTIKERGLLEGLIEHERVEGILMRHGFKYPQAHVIATVAENRVYRRQGNDPARMQAKFPRLERRARFEAIKKAPADLDCHPYTDAPADAALLVRLRAAMTATR